MGEFVLYLLLTAVDGGFNHMEELDRYSDRSNCLKVAAMLTAANVRGEENTAVYIDPKDLQPVPLINRSNTIRFACITVFNEESPFSGDK